MYKKIKGTAYRTYFACVEPKCNAQIIIHDLKGGFIKVVQDHRNNCKNVPKDRLSLDLK